MKKNIFVKLICALLVAFMMGSCASAPRSFDDLNKMDDVTHIYVGQGMMTMLGGFTKYLDNFKLGSIINDISSVRLISCSDADAIKRITPFINKLEKGFKGATVLNTSNSTEKFIIYAKPSTNDPTRFTEAMIVSKAGPLFNTLIIQGNFSLDQLKGLKVK